MHLCLLLRSDKHSVVHSRNENDPCLLQGSIFIRESHIQNLSILYYFCAILWHPQGFKFSLLYRWSTRTACNMRTEREVSAKCKFINKWPLSKVDICTAAFKSVKQCICRNKMTIRGWFKKYILHVFLIFFLSNSDFLFELLNSATKKQRNGTDLMLKTFFDS